MKQIALILSGCGFQDGSEITETVSALIALSQCQAQVHAFAPDKTFSSVDHLNAENSGDRNVLTESARIVRGKIRALSHLNPEDFDGLVIPGGFGAALHLCTWASEGADCKVLPDMVRILTEFHSQSKPIGAICIAPALVAKVLGHHELTLTIGEDEETAQEIQKTGAIHEPCVVSDYITDRENKVVTTPAYMYDQAQPDEVFTGISGLVKELVEMA
jgi:enhancing lycopene biosynthesis protein 2